MLIGLLRVDLLLPGCYSLKDKRSVIKKHLFRIRKSYNVAVAETDHNEIWNRAELSFITMNTLKEPVENILHKILHELDTSCDMQVLSECIEIL